MLGSGTCALFIGLAPYFGVLEQPAYLIIIWGLNGLFQATGWPSTIALMNRWFSKKKRGISTSSPNTIQLGFSLFLAYPRLICWPVLVFGTWATNSSVGNIICGLVAAGLFTANHRWPVIFFIFGSLIVAVGT